METKPRELSTNITLDDGTASLDLALEVANHFKLSAKRARAIVGQVGKVVARWDEDAGELRIRKADRERMTSALNHDDLQKAAHIR
jgi:serine/threonine-protein kinase HipA